MAKKKSTKAGLPATLRPIKENVRANQWVGNPRQEKFVRLYMDPTSPTFGNSFQSAVEAGYTESYSRIVANPSIANKWVKEYKDLVALSPEHIVAALQQEAMNHGQNRGSERIKALELLAKMNGMLVERSIVGHASLEQAIADLK